MVLKTNSHEKMVPHVHINNMFLNNVNQTPIHSLHWERGNPIHSLQWEKGDPHTLSTIGEGIPPYTPYNGRGDNPIHSLQWERVYPHTPPTMREGIPPCTPSPTYSTFAAVTFLSRHQGFAFASLVRLMVGIWHPWSIPPGCLSIDMPKKI